MCYFVLYFHIDTSTRNQEDNPQAAHTHEDTHTHEDRPTYGDITEDHMRADTSEDTSEDTTDGGKTDCCTNDNADSVISCRPNNHSKQRKITEFMRPKQVGGNANVDLQDVPGTSNESDDVLRARKKQQENQKRPSNEPESSTSNSKKPKKSSIFNKANFSWDLIKETHNRRFNASEKVYSLKVNQSLRGGVGNVLNQIGEILEAFIDAIRQDLQPRDFIRLVIISPELRDPIGIPWALVRDMDVEAILSLIEKVLQSNQHFYIHSGVSIIVKHVHNPQGGVRGALNKKDPLNNDDLVKFKRSLIKVSNKDDNLCFGKAVIKAMYHKNGPLTHPKWKSIQNENKILDTLTKDLYKEAGVPEGKVASTDYAKFQDVLAKHDIRLMIYSMRYANSYIFRGPDDMAHSIYLYHYDDHYVVISSMSAFLNRHYFCKACLVGYQTKNTHHCEGLCSQCKTDQCDAKGPDLASDRSKWKKCDDCHRHFKTNKCYELHLENTCANFYICSDCSSFVNMKKIPGKRDHHVCGDRYCQTCSSYVPQDHVCYMKVEKLPDGDPKKVLPEKLLFFDFECQQNTGKHIPNFVVARWMCTNCLDIPLDAEDRDVRINECPICEEELGEREVVFKGKDTVEKFCLWLFQPRPNQTEVGENGKERLVYRTTVIAHNAQSYDLYFIMNHMIKNGCKPDMVIRRGGKILHMARRQSNIRFIDSLSFLTMPLSKMPACFGLPSPKGTFPHYFNTPENENYIGPLPAAHFYGVDSMMPKARAEFMRWYDAEVAKGTVFNFQEEILKYCRLDVEILEGACIKFRELFMKLTSLPKYKGIDPFKHSVTLASACNLVFRSLYLKKDTIPLLPSDGFPPPKPQSKKALEWLHYQAVKLNCNIEREVKIGGYHCDGYARGINTVFEYNGCAVHGHLSCYPPTMTGGLFSNGKSMGQKFQETRRRIEAIKNAPEKPRVIEVWECEFDAVLKDKSHEAYQIVQDANISPHLSPRAAFFGGRCNAFKLYHDCAPGEKIRYFDFTSLYPYTNKVKRYPIGGVEVIRDNFTQLDDYFGLVQCIVLPPQDLYLPLLPSKPNGGKLTFALCRTCAETEQQTPCRHDERSRMFRGVWVSEELKKGVELGYKIIKFEEVWHFKSSSVYDPDKKEGGLFSEYINTFLKVKQESSGWPEGVVTDDQKDQYIQDYLREEGIALEKQNIVPNPGLRAVAKLMLNTLWGKFGQSEDLLKTEYIDNPADVLQLLGSAKIEVDDLTFHNEHLCEAHYKTKSEFRQPNVNINVVIAAFTTAYARLKLYSVLEKVEPSAIMYGDTDSLVMIERPGEYLPPLGNYLGELTDEIDPKDGFIQTFVSGGPKNYAMKLSNGKTIVKIRGITLNSAASELINFDTVKEIVRPHSNLTTIRVPLKGKITRDVKNKEIVNKDTHKDYRVVYTKRVLLPNGVDTVPYGFKR